MTAKEIEANASKLRDELGIVTLQRGTVAVAGQDLRCYERNESGLQGQGAAVLNLDCVPTSEDGEFSASFVGSEDHVPAFYSLLRTVRRPARD